MTRVDLGVDLFSVSIRIGKLSNEIKAVSI